MRTEENKGYPLVRFSLVTVLILSACLLPLAAGAAEPVSAQLDRSPPFSLVVLASRLTGADDVTVIDLKSLEAAGAVTVGDALRLAPEVRILRYGRGSDVETIGIKGMGTAQAAVFLDGAPLPATGVASIFDVPLADVERIEIAKGDPAAFGGGGAIRIVTKGASLPSAGYVTSPSRFPHRDILAIDGGTIGKTRYLFTVAHASTQATGPDHSDRERYVRFRLERELPSSSQVSAGFTWTLTEWDAPLIQESPSPLAHGYRDLAAGDVAWMKEMSSGVLEARGYAQRAREIDEAISGSPSQDDVSVGGEIRATLETRAGEAVFGAAARRESDQSRSTYAANLFAKLSRPFGESAQATFGGQFNLVPNLDPVFSPSVQVKLLPFHHTAMRASLSHAVRPVTLEDLQAHAGGSVPLRAQSGWRYELGLSHRLSWGLLDVDLFRERSSDRIYWLPDAKGVRRPQNLEETVTQGVDLSASAPLTGDWSSFVGWRWTSDKDARTGQALPFAPRHELRWGLRYQGGATRGSLELRVVGPRFADAGSTLPAQTMANGRIVHAAGRHIDLFAEGYNLFDAREVDTAHGGPAGRTLMIGASWNF